LGDRRIGIASAPFNASYATCHMHGEPIQSLDSPVKLAHVHERG
jgi:hypothetical protein